MKVYPNPSADFATVELAGLYHELLLVNSLGKIEMRLELVGYPASVKVPLNELPSGVYTVIAVGKKQGKAFGRLAKI